MSELDTFMKVAAPPLSAAQRAVSMVGRAPQQAAAAAAAANPAQQAQRLEQRIVNNAAKGQMHADVVPQHLNSAVNDRQLNRDIARQRLDGRQELGALRGHASTPEREAAQKQLRNIPQHIDGKSNPAFFEARKNYGQMPHSPEHQAKVDAYVEQRRTQQSAGAAQALSAHTDRTNAMPAMPADYQHGKAMARAAFDVNNQWHRNMPAMGALAGGAIGALTADTEEGESRLTRGLAGAAAGGALGYGVRRGAPHVAGFMAQSPGP